MLFVVPDWELNGQRQSISEYRLNFFIQKGRLNSGLYGSGLIETIVRCLKLSAHSIICLLPTGTGTQLPNLPPLPHVTASAYCLCNEMPIGA
jgi:hypothetical protein